VGEPQKVRAGGAVTYWLAAAAPAPGRTDTAFLGKQDASAQGARGRRAGRGEAREGSPHGEHITAERVYRAAEEADPVGENRSKKQNLFHHPFSTTGYGMGTRCFPSCRFWNASTLMPLSPRTPLTVPSTV